ncbi:unnamed protein product [Cuscuta europaea]|uniref:Uncharacterized protein n=1 Tax=Cuscuta europaea TaxID=41803 RepID=A0A9P1E348_CUSEU|nr:unnamed protein product [Cuscuta europaea]
MSTFKQVYTPIHMHVQTPSLHQLRSVTETTIKLINHKFQLTSRIACKTPTLRVKNQPTLATPPHLKKDIVLDVSVSTQSGERDQSSNIKQVSTTINMKAQKLSVGAPP